jgi:hypothetical protein
MSPGTQYAGSFFLADRLFFVTSSPRTISQQEECTFTKKYFVFNIPQARGSTRQHFFFYLSLYLLGWNKQNLSKNSSK